MYKYDLPRQIKSVLLLLHEWNVILRKNYGGIAQPNTSSCYPKHHWLDSITYAIDYQGFSCGIFLDFSKAFDTVNHNILIERLDYYGSRGVTRLGHFSYLIQQISICFLGANWVWTSTCFLWCSSRLNSWPSSSCSEILDFYLFANDAKLFYKHKNLRVLEPKVKQIFILGWVLTNFQLIMIS